MKFCWCTINVENMEDSLRFYQEIVGLNLERRFNAGPGMEIAFLGEGETKIELICNGKKPSIGEDISVGFVVKSLDDMMDFVSKKGIKIHSGPFSPNPHTSFFHVKDPNGLNVQFVEFK